MAKAIHRLGWELLANTNLKAGCRSSSALSPLSIAVAVTMLAGAASEERKTSLLSIMGMQASKDGSRAPSNALKATSSGPVTMANAIFVDQTVQVLKTYSSYLETLDAKSQTYPSIAGSVDEINGWIQDNTRGHIRDMLSSGDLQQCHAILVNALAFTGTWQTQFDTKHTMANHRFRGGPNGDEKVAMMYGRGRSAATAKSGTYTAVSLPYESASEDTRMSMLAYLPNENTSLQAVSEELAARGPPTSFRTIKYAKFGFPKFEINADFSLLDELRSLHFPVDGEFPGFGSGSNVVQYVLHKAFVKVNEEGTEAAAATVVAMTRSIRPQTEPPEILIFDRPFLFSVIDETAELPVISGVYVGS